MQIVVLQMHSHTVCISVLSVKKAWLFLFLTYFRLNQIYTVLIKYSFLQFIYTINEHISKQVKSQHT